MTRHPYALLLIALGSTTGLSLPAHAAEPQDDRFDRLLRVLVEQGVLTPEKAKAVAEEASAPDQKIPVPMVVASPAPAPAPPASGPVAAAPQSGLANADPSVHPAAPVVRNAASAVAAEWTRRFQINGDFRFRWQAEYYSKNTSPVDCR